MIDYPTFCQIHLLHDQRGLSVAQIARELTLDEKTVAKWASTPSYHPRQKPHRSSKLDPWRGDVVRLLEQHPYSAMQILQRLREKGFQGSYTILKDLIRQIRPKRPAAFLTLSFAPGQCAQVDWGCAGSITVGSTRRRLSFFVMVLCYSRMIYVEFTLAESMEHFLACHLHAFDYFGGVPAAMMVDNCKCAVLDRPWGEPAVFNPRYLDFARHYGFTIKACGVRKPHEKGRVENGVGYVKKNFLFGMEQSQFSAVNPAARLWLDGTANLRIHGETRQRPLDLLAAEKPHLKPLAPMPYDVGIPKLVRATNRFRIVLDTNRYSVPPEYASASLNLRLYPDCLRIYHNHQIVAEHIRCYDRHQDFENPDHVRKLLGQRRKANEQRILLRFMALTPRAEEYYRQLGERRFNPQHHVQKIIALSEIYGAEKTARAIEDALSFAAFSSEYIANILEQQQRLLPEPGALHLTRRSDLLEIETPQPDLSIYEPSTSSQP